MRADQPRTEALARQTQAAYQARWAEWKPWCVLSLNGDRTPERIEGFHQRHHDRIRQLHQALGIPMKIIARRQLDDPRISEPELQRRIREAKLSRDKMNPWKNKGGRRGKMHP